MFEIIKNIVIKLNTRGRKMEKKFKHKLYGCIAVVISLCAILCIIIVLNVNKGKDNEKASSQDTVAEETTPEPSETEKTEENTSEPNKKKSEDVEEPTATPAPEEKETEKASAEDSKEKSKEETKEETQSVVCNNFYSTRYGEVNAVECPQFEFHYPDGWKITQEVVNSDPNEEIEEQVTLENGRGVTIDYIACGHIPGGSSSVLVRDVVTKVADSSFAPSYPGGTDEDYSDLGKFMVAKIETTDEYFPGVDTDFVPLDQKIISYAVVPESYAGVKEDVGEAYSINMYSFNYPTPYEFSASSTDGTFTEQEEQEVIAILQSFTGG